LFIGAMAIAPYTVYVGDVWVGFGGGDFGFKKYTINPCTFSYMGNYIRLKRTYQT